MKNIIRKNSPLKFNIDTREGEESEGKAKLSNHPKSFHDDCSSMFDLSYSIFETRKQNWRTFEHLVTVFCLNSH